MSYILPNGNKIDEAGLEKAFVDTHASRKCFLDLETGGVEYGKVVAQNSVFNKKHYVEIPKISATEQLKWLRDFVKEIIPEDDKALAETLKVLIGKEKVGDESKTLKQSLQILEKDKEGWIHGWVEWHAHNVWEVMKDWLSNLPIEIEEKFEGFDDCELCKLFEQDSHTVGDFMEAKQKQERKENNKGLKPFDPSSLADHESEYALAMPLASRNKRKNKSMSSVIGETGKIFQFKITLNDSKPSIWRRIQVPAEYTFFDLHSAIQDSIGWTDSHLHGFRIAQKGTARPTLIQYPNPEADFGFGDDIYDEREEYIANYFGKTIKQCLYDYDFGDGWSHTVLLEKELVKEKDVQYPRCVAGKNACPPEDCGGWGGYEDLKKILKNPKHPEHNDMLEWLNIENASMFDPNEFDPKEVVFINPRTQLEQYQTRFNV